MHAVAAKTNDGDRVSQSRGVERQSSLRALCVGVCGCVGGWVGGCKCVCVCMLVHKPPTTPPTTHLGVELPLTPRSARVRALPGSVMVRDKSNYGEGDCMISVSLISILYVSMVRVSSRFSMEQI